MAKNKLSIIKNGDGAVKIRALFKQIRKRGNIKIFF
jgi:hypothetical protein